MLATLGSLAVNRCLAVLGTVYLLLAGLALPGAPFAAEPSPADRGASDAQQPAEPGADPSVPAPAVAAQPADTPSPKGEAVTGSSRLSQDAPDRRARSAASRSVTIKDFAFSPATVTVNVGETVTWTNRGPSAHTATATDKSFDTGLLSKGKSASHRFTVAGTFSYYCKPHPFMKGKVQVIGSANRSASGSSSGGSSSGSSSHSGGSSSSHSSGSHGRGSLPATGLDAALLAGLGLAMLGLGATLRRRTA